jgi:hypothetical protein
MISRASIVNTSAFAHEVASLKPRVEGPVERMIDRESLYAGLESAGQRTV